VQQRGASLLVFALVGLLVAFLFTEYRPTLTARSYLLNAQSSRLLNRPHDVKADYLAAAAADPWDPEPWRGLGELRLHDWLASPTEQNWHAFIEAAERFRAANPQNQGNFDTLGRWYLLAASQPESMDKAENLRRAIEYFERATTLYPNGSRLWAQLAWTLHLAGRDDEAQRAADRAWQLDQQNPHAEQKLANLFLFDPLGPDSRKTNYRPEPAEQSLLDLRSSSGR
jgi:tetratricopeptide (TPR) repeat protein